MSARSVLATLALLALPTAMLASAPPVTVAARPGAPRAVPAPHARTLYADRFPPGPGDDIAGRACAICHSPMLVTQQAKDSLGWEKTLALMEKWGAPIAAGEHDSLRTYLLARFGAKPAAR